MRDYINQLKKDRIIRQSYIFTAFFLCFSVLAVLFAWNHLPPVLPLYNQAPWGDPRLANKPFIFLPIFISFIYMVGNFLLGRFFITTMPLVTRFLAITSICCAILVFIFLFRIFQLIL